MMVRHYKSKGASKTKYSPEALKQACSAVMDGRMSQRQASATFGVPKTTLQQVLSGKTQSPGAVGRKTALLPFEEESLAQNIAALGDYGLAFDMMDMRKFVQYYLDKEKRHVDVFQNNFPGEDWARGFLSRHSNLLSNRVCQNISRKRAAVSENEGKDMMEPLGQSVKVEVKEEPADMEVSASKLPSPTSSRHSEDPLSLYDTMGVKDHSEGASSLYDTAGNKEDVSIKDEPVEDGDLLNSTTTLDPNLNSGSGGSRLKTSKPLSAPVASLHKMNSEASSKSSGTPRHKRGANWTRQMEVYLLQLIDERKEFVECKRFNSYVTHACVTKAWEEITKLMAASASDYVLERLSVQKKWWALKKKGREELHTFKRNISRTGSSAPFPPLSDIAILVSRILGDTNASISGVEKDDILDTSFISLEKPLGQNAPEEGLLVLADDTPTISLASSPLSSAPLSPPSLSPSPPSLSPAPRTMTFSSKPVVVTVNTSQRKPGSEDYEEERRKLDLAFHGARLVKEQKEAEMLEAKKAAYAAMQAAQEAARAASEAARTASEAARAASEAARVASEADAALKTFMLHKNM